MSGVCWRRSRYFFEGGATICSNEFDGLFSSSLGAHPNAFPDPYGKNTQDTDKAHEQPANKDGLSSARHLLSSANQNPLHPSSLAFDSDCRVRAWSGPSSFGPTVTGDRFSCLSKPASSDPLRLFLCRKGECCSLLFDIESYLTASTLVLVLLTVTAGRFD